ncbi:uncharacterized protein A4U43_C09F13590 [Asparagus officinalis]|uniref:Uncharacterized protein n=1 Tax=Asparagus officinalis TaxID=4686 RepID=A0A5P1E789_ASPOF|nr:uncharacterized protein A4U43_C09F13590 [Asparagus officinalis]
MSRAAKSRRAMKLRRADVEEFKAARRSDPERVSRSSRPLGGVIRSGVEGNMFKQMNTICRTQKSIIYERIVNLHDPERVSRSLRPLGGVIRSGVEGKVEGKVEESGVEADRRRDPERCRG